MVWNIGLFFYFFSLTQVQSAHSAERNFSFCYDPYPPYASTEASTSTISGIKPGIARLIGTDRGFVAQIKLLPLVRCLEAVKKGSIDAVLPLFKTPEREKFMDFSQTVLTQTSSFVYRTTSFPEGLNWNTFDDLKKYRVGMVRGSHINRLMEETIGEKKTIFLSSDPATLMKMLAGGRLDLVPVDTRVAKHLIRQEGFSSKLSISEKIISQEESYFGVARNPQGKQLINEINLFLNSAAGKNAIQDLLENYDKR